MRTQQRLAQLCKALGHPARLTIIRALLQERECLSGELSERLPLAASTVSQHLKILAKAGLVRGQVDGPRRCYCIDHRVLAELHRLIEQLKT